MGAALHELILETASCYEFEGSIYFCEEQFTVMKMKE
jgi:hypothetical protein